jgi:hypothetical protein
MNKLVKEGDEWVEKPANLFDLLNPVQQLATPGGKAVRFTLYALIATLMA